MRTAKVLAGGALSLLLLIGGPQTAQAQTVWDASVCGGTFNPCVDFELVAKGTRVYGSQTKYVYSFFVTYVSVDNTQPGSMTAAGLYDYDPDGTKDWEFGNIVLIQPTGGNWSLGGDSDCQQLSGGGKLLFQACVATTDGINSGVPYPGTIEFEFTSKTMIAASDFAFVGDLGARVHIQGVDEIEDCSYKLDSPLGLVSGCGKPVPEPATGLLLGTALLGLGVVGYRTRREEDEEV